MPTWKRNRRILDLCFKQHLLDVYLEMFNEQAGRFVELVAEEVGKGEVDLTEKITRSVLETTCREFKRESLYCMKCLYLYCNRGSTGVIKVARRKKIWYDRYRISKKLFRIETTYLYVLCDST